MAVFTSGDVTLELEQAVTLLYRDPSTGSNYNLNGIGADGRTAIRAAFDSIDHSITLAVGASMPDLTGVDPQLINDAAMYLAQAAGLTIS